MSSYWQNLMNVSNEDSELLKDYKDLSDKINDYFSDKSPFTDFRQLRPVEFVSQKKQAKPCKKAPIAPQNLEKRAEARISRKTTISTIEQPKRKVHKRSNTMKQTSSIDMYVRQSTGSQLII